MRVDPGAPADESSPVVQLMRKFGEVATLAARQHSTGQLSGPDQIYSVEMIAIGCNGRWPAG